MNLHGFELLQEENIPELNTKAYLYRHIKSGAELLSLQNDDENKVFGITFRTPPSDSTGIAHIMEHCVLGGSRKYQVREPFVELLKGSLNTFVNAFTSSDWTTYPVASQNVQDFYNLVDVYLDAVFYPLITPHHLDQEGWHYELEDIDAPLTIKGIVFNEMKGAYSSADDLFGRYNQQALFPDNTYGLDSGGDPLVIPELTYAQFKNFHDTFYHPANSRIFFYGDDDLEERLRITNAYLKDFEAIEIDSSIPLQSRFETPRRITRPYSVEGDEELERKGKVMVNWLLPENDDPTRTLALAILSHTLMGTPASPLRKALIDSGLGEDATGRGLSASTRQMTFSAGLKGTNPAETEKAEALILETLAALARDGFEKEMIEASVNTIEFQLRENNTGNFPRGLGLMLGAMETWLYDRDPLAGLAFEEALTAVKTNLSHDPAYFQELIQTWLLDNPHRATVAMEPDPAMAQRMEAEEKERLAAAKAAMSREELEAIIENGRLLKIRQETPDSPEALAAIPTLTLDDLEKENKEIPIAAAKKEGAELLYHDLFTNGILYLDIGFDLHLLPQELLPYAGILGDAMLGMGTETEDYVKLSQRIGRKTGGIHASALNAAKIDADDSASLFVLRGKSTVAQTADLLAILRDVLLTTDFDDKERFLQIVLKAKASEEAGLARSGHAVVNTRLGSHFNEADWVSEQIGGIEFLFFLRKLEKAIREDWTAVLDNLKTVRQILLNRNGMVCNVTVDGENYAAIEPQLNEFITAVPAADPLFPDWSFDANRSSEGLTIPAQVNYVGKGANLYKLGYKLHGSALAINKYLGMTWLWEKVRVGGGAYGGFVRFDRLSGMLNYLSYRDPNLMGTVENYDGTAVFLRNLQLSPEELTKSIIGTIGDIDNYQLPDAKGYTSMLRHLVGSTAASRQRLRDEVLSTTTADFKAFADALDTVKEHGIVVVLGSQDAINAVNDDNWLTVSKVM